MSTGIRCELLLDGQHFADGSAGDAELEPTALSGLKITWGRSTTVDQPEPSTCDFDVMDLPGGDTFLSKLRTGRRIDVNASATIYPDPDQPTIADPSFELTPIGEMPPSILNNADAAVTPGTGSSVVLDGTNRLTDPNATRAYPVYSAGQGVVDVVSVADHPLGIPTANRSTWAAGSANVGFLLTPALQPGESVTISAWVRTDTPVAAGFAIFGVIGAPNVNVTTQWQRVSWSYTISGVLTRQIGFRASAGAGTDAGTLFITGIQLEDGPVLSDFIAGNLPEEPIDPSHYFTFTWDGAPDASASHRWLNEVISRNVIMLPRNAAQPASVIFAPDDFSDLPNAWDQLPVTAPGQQWVVGASVQAPAGAVIRVQPAYFSRPNGAYSLGGEVLQAVATGAWQQMQLTVTPQLAGRWVGVMVTVSDLPRWVDMAGPWLGVAGSWLDYETTRIDDLIVLAPAAGTTRTVSVFSGRITDLQAKWDETFAPAGGTRITVTAQDFTADLDNINIGDEPWAVESMQARFLRILALSQADVDAQIDTSVANYLISYQDVDNQPVAGLLKDLAQSVDAVLWSAVHQTTGPYLRVEDPSNRAALYTLEQGEDGIVRIVPIGEVEDAQQITACDVLRDPVAFDQSVADVSTRVAVTWLEQGLDEDGQVETTERTVTVIDQALEVDYGYRRISFSTMLQSGTDAYHVAERILARTSLTGWRATGFTIDDPDSLQLVDQPTILMMLRLLDGTSRIGLPIQLTGMPEWTPVGGLLPVYLEGGTYSFDDGAWTLALTVSRASAMGGSVAWAGLDMAWSWLDFDPAISWLDLNGVSYSAPTPLPAPIGVTP
ncbi:MAG: hypothetical protein FWF90_16230 [Promicromonosporaceae bacterium]|nr:hypothetical protein [Promicromonosporaceae bacterium]